MCFAVSATSKTSSSRVQFARKIAAIGNDPVDFRSSAIQIFKGCLGLVCWTDAQEILINEQFPSGMDDHCLAVRKRQFQSRTVFRDDLLTFLNLVPDL